MSERVWTEAEIEEAFWATFHRKGELFFNYLDSEAINAESTKDYWLDLKTMLLAQGEKSRTESGRPDGN